MLFWGKPILYNDRRLIYWLQIIFYLALSVQCTMYISTTEKKPSTRCVTQKVIIIFQFSKLPNNCQHEKNYFCQNNIIKIEKFIVLYEYFIILFTYIWKCNTVYSTIEVIFQNNKIFFQQKRTIKSYNQLYVIQKLSTLTKKRDAFWMTLFPQYLYIYFF